MASADKQSGLVQGTLEMLILKTLALEPMHAYGIGVRIEQISKGVFVVNAGSLFPAFRRLERGGLIKGEWRATENNRRAKYYALTAPGTGEAQTPDERLGSADERDRENSQGVHWRGVMTCAQALVGGFRGLLHKTQVEQELDAELRNVSRDRRRTADARAA